MVNTAQEVTTMFSADAHEWQSL